jgi:hypothetical protein
VSGPRGATDRAKPVEAGFIAVVVLATVAAFALRIPLLKIRGFDADEFQHLHGAYCLAHGLLPYRDYFDHHTPWLHLLLSAMLPLSGESVATVFRARYLMLAFAGAMVILTFWLGTLLRGRLTGGVAALLLSYNTIFVWKSLEIRPDTAAAAFWLFALGGVIKGFRSDRLRWHFAAGLALGAAVMFTQKALFAAAGLALAFLWAAFDRRTGIRIGRLVRSVGVLTVGAALPIGATVLFFWAHGALTQFVDSNFLLNARWKRAIPVTEFLTRYVNENSYSATLALAGLALASVCMLRQEGVREARFVPVIACWVLAGGLYVIPVPYMQYYLLCLPILSIFAASLLMAALGSREDHPPKLHPVAILLVTVCVIWSFQMTVSSRFIPEGRGHILAWITALGFIAAGHVAWHRWPARLARLASFRHYALLCVLAALLVLPSQRIVGLGFRWTNRAQTERLRYIMERSRPTDAVLDGFSGYGTFRPHAYFYYFLLPELQVMLTERQRGEDVVRALDSGRTRFVVYDDYVRALRPEVQEYINAHYRPTGEGEILERVAGVP